MPRPYILVVNDNALVCDFTSQILERHGYDVTTAADGEQALDVIRKTTPDLMLIDVVMRGMDGVQIVALMEKPVPFLIHSALNDDDPRVAFLMELGALGRVSQRSLLTGVARALGS